MQIQISYKTKLKLWRIKENGRQFLHSCAQKCVKAFPPNSLRQILQFAVASGLK